MRHVTHSPPAVVGTVEIPAYQTKQEMYREIVENIPEDKATVLEFESFEALPDGQRRLHTAGLALFGQRGCIKTKRDGYVNGGLQLLVWRVEQPGQQLELALDDGKEGKTE